MKKTQNKTTNHNLKIIQGQCKKQSRKVLMKDLKRVLKLIPGMVELCRKPLGKFPCAFAIAHCQINHDDPMRFFVTFEGRVFINPKINLDLTETISELEGCYSYAFREAKITKRYKTVLCECLHIDSAGGMKALKSKFEGKPARILQHEIDHFNGKAIYK